MSASWCSAILSSSSQWNSYGPISCSHRSIPELLFFWHNLTIIIWSQLSQMCNAHDQHHHRHRLHDVTVHPLVPRYQSQSAEPRGKITFQADNAKSSPQLWMALQQKAIIMSQHYHCHHQHHHFHHCQQCKSVTTVMNGLAEQKLFSFSASTLWFASPASPFSNLIWYDLIY